MNKNILKELVMISSLIAGIGMVYARWSGAASIVVDIWNTIFICSVSYSEITKKENKSRDTFYRIWVIATGVLLISYILITIL